MPRHDDKSLPPRQHPRQMRRLRLAGPLSPLNLASKLSSVVLSSARGGWEREQNKYHDLGDDGCSDEPSVDDIDDDIDDIDDTSPPPPRSPRPTTTDDASASLATASKSTAASSSSFPRTIFVVVPHGAEQHVSGGGCGGGERTTTAGGRGGRRSPPPPPAATPTLPPPRGSGGGPTTPFSPSSSARFAGGLGGEDHRRSAPIPPPTPSSSSFAAVDGGEAGSSMSDKENASSSSPSSHAAAASGAGMSRRTDVAPVADAAGGDGGDAADAGAAGSGGREQGAAFFAPSAATMQSSSLLSRQDTTESSSLAGLRVVIPDGSSSTTTGRCGTDGSSPAGSLLAASGDGGDDREDDGADSVAAAAFAAAFAAECDDDGDDDDDDIGLAIAESSSTIDLDAHLTREEVMFGVPEVDDFGAMVDVVVVDDVENGTTTTSSYRTPIESHGDAETEEEDDDDVREEDARATTARGGFASRYLVVGRGSSPSCAVTVTPTENGDVILMTPVEEMMDVGPQPRGGGQRSSSAVGTAAALLIPSLGAGEEWSNGRRGGDGRGPAEVAGPSKPARMTRKTTNATEASPTGVDGLRDSDEDEECDDDDDDLKVGGGGRREGEERRAEEVAAAPSKPTYGMGKTTNATEASPTGVDEFGDRESQDNPDEFLACDSWYGRGYDCDPIDDGASSSPSQPFGPFKIHDLTGGRKCSRDVQHGEDGRMGEDQSVHHEIQLRHSLESDCGQSQSSSSLDAVIMDDPPPVKRGQSMGEESNESKETHATLESFHQVYTSVTGSSAAESTEDKDEDTKSAELDEPGDYFDSDYRVQSIKPASIGLKGGEIPDFIRDIVKQEYSSGSSGGGSRPWAKHDSDVKQDGDFELDSCESDLVTVPSESSMLSLGKVQVARSMSPSSSTVPDVLPGDNGEPSLAKENFSNLRNFWVHEWRGMATTAEPDYSHIDQPKFMLKEEVGDAMCDDNESVEKLSTSSSLTAHAAAPENNIITDRDGNKYLRIYDLNSGKNLYEVIQQRSYELETVEERSCEEETVEERSCVEEEDKEEHQKEGKGEGKKVGKTANGTGSTLLDVLSEKTVESEARNIAGSNQTIASLEDLYSLFDAYQGTLKHDENEHQKHNENDHQKHDENDHRNETAVQPPPAGLELLRIVASPKKLLTHDDDYNPDDTADQPPPAGLELIRHVKSSKKFRIHLKKLAIVKAKSERTKCDLFSRIETKSRRRALFREELELSEAGPDIASQPLQASHRSLDTILSQVLNAISTGENYHLEVEAPQNIEDYDASTVTETPEAYRMVERKFLYGIINDLPFDPSKKELNDHPMDLKKMDDYLVDPTSNESHSVINDDSSLAQSAQSSVPSFSVNTHTSAATTHDELVKHASKRDFMSDFSPSVFLSNLSVDSHALEENPNDEDQPSPELSPDLPELRKGSTPMLEKLYEENAELIETLANTQRELAVAQFKLRLAATEIDDMISTARYEI